MTIKIRQDFMDYQAVHNFIHPEEPLKKWLNEDQYINIYKKDWNSLMEVVEKVMYKCFELDENEEIDEDVISMFYDIRDCIPNIIATYRFVVGFINWYNENKGS